MFYNPVIGRFTQEDEYRGDGLNLYAYVGNNPVNYVDPSGYDSESKENPYDGDKGPGEKNPDQLMLPSGNEINDKSRMLPEGAGKTFPKGASFEGNIYRSVNSAYDPLEMN